MGVCCDHRLFKLGQVSNKIQKVLTLARAYLTDQIDGMSVCLFVCPSANVLKLHTKKERRRRTLEEEKKREEKEGKKDPEFELRVQILHEISSM